MDGVVLKSSFDLLSNLKKKRHCIRFQHGKICGRFLATFEEMNVEIKDSLYALFAIRKMGGVVLKSFGNDVVLGMLKSVKRKDIVYVFNAKRFLVVF